jgi:hypothetical protein
LQVEGERFTKAGVSLGRLSARAKRRAAKKKNTL